MWLIWQLWKLPRAYKASTIAGRPTLKMLEDGALSDNTSKPFRSRPFVNLMLLLTPMIIAIALSYCIGLRVWFTDLLQNPKALYAGFISELSGFPTMEAEYFFGMSFVINCLGAVLDVPLLSSYLSLVTVSNFAWLRHYRKVGNACKQQRYLLMTSSFRRWPSLGLTLWVSSLPSAACMSPKPKLLDAFFWMSWADLMHGFSLLSV